MLSLAQPVTPAAGRRRGMVLLVGITLLTLFAVVGLSFVYYAEAEATSAKLARESETLVRPDVDSELALSLFLNQLIYGVRDDETGAYSALRGHDLARGMFGLNYEFQPDGSVLLGTNETPFNGTGRLHLTQDYKNARTGNVLFNADDYELINYTFFAAD